MNPLVEVCSRAVLLAPLPHSGFHVVLIPPFSYYLHPRPRPPLWSWQLFSSAVGHLEDSLPEV